MDFSKAGSNKMLKTISDSSLETLATTSIQEIPMDLIDENPDNEAVFNMDGIDFLAKTIEKEGWTGAIEVLALPNGRYEISAGHRRYRAMQLLNKKTIPCIIARNVDSRAKARKLLSSNIRNRDMTPLDWGRAIRYFAETVSEEGELNAKSKKECMDFFGFTESKISRYLALTELIPDLQKYVAMDGFPSSALSTASRLSEDDQLVIAEKIEERIAQIAKFAREEAVRNGQDLSEAFVDLSLISKRDLTNEIDKLRLNVHSRGGRKVVPENQGISTIVREQPLPKPSTTAEIGHAGILKASTASSPVPVPTVTQPTRAALESRRYFEFLSSLEKPLTAEERVWLIQIKERIGELL